MTTTSLELGPFLASDLPPAPSRPGALAALRRHLVLRWQERAFERALDQLGHAQHSELLALARRG